MLNIVIPMAGRGSRFVKAGFTIPKPMIPVGGVPMILLVIHNLTPQQPYRFIFLCLEEHIQLYQIDQQLKAWAPNCEIIVVDQVTEGAACTVLLAKSFINNEDPLMIANSDHTSKLQLLLFESVFIHVVSRTVKNYYFQS